MEGKEILHYRIFEELGRGGMGVVYRAQDTSLDRLVVLKFLPPDLTASGDERARFVQEAKTAAALSHPNICSIHSVEVVDGQTFIVMEYVEGKTLKTFIPTIPLKRAVDIGIQIAEGLAAAHEKGIIHRDVKPDNIMIRKDGRALIMDFGLALLSTGPRITKVGSTVGTIGYMSPEQVQGQDTDQRSDIFSLGVVLYEMFTGESPFKGAHETAITYEIVNVVPTIPSKVKPEIDPNLDAVVMECLEKEPSERYQSVAEVTKDLRRAKRQSGRGGEEVKSYSGQEDVNLDTIRHGSYSPGGRRRELLWMLSAVILAVACCIIFFSRFRPNDDIRGVLRSSILAPERTSFVTQVGGHIALSADGTMLAFVARDSSGVRRLWVRALDEITPRCLNSTEGAEYPFWGPDDRMLGFFADGKLKLVDISGTPAQTLCAAPWSRGGAWSHNGTIIFSPSPFASLMKISASGGNPHFLTRLDTTRQENSHRWPVFLPDGNHFIFLNRARGKDADIVCIGSLDSTEKSRILLRASSNISYSAGYVLFMRDRSLLAQPFDPLNLRLSGEALPIADGVEYQTSYNRGIFSASSNGLLVYQQGGISAGSKQILWYDRDGRKLGTAGKAGDPLDLRLSPDGNRIAMSWFDPQTRNYDIWIHGGSNLWTRFTFDPAIDRCPIWSPDGTQIVFSSDRRGHWDMYRKAANGAGAEELLADLGSNAVATDWSPDGDRIAFVTFGETEANADLWMLDLNHQGSNGKPAAVPFLRTEANEGQGAVFSPDGKWIAYQSDESGRVEVYVRALSGAGGKWQISSAGGTRPHWRHDEKEIFYLDEDQRITSVDIKSNGAALEVGAVHPLFKVDAVTNAGGISYIDASAYEIAPDGRRFLVNVFLDSASVYPVTLVANWDKMLAKK